MTPRSTWPRFLFSNPEHWTVIVEKDGARVRAVARHSSGERLASAWYEEDNGAAEVDVWDRIEVLARGGVS